MLITGVFLSFPIDLFQQSINQQAQVTFPFP